MLAIELPEDIERRLDALVKATGRSKEATLVAAVAEYLDDLEDLAIAERRLADIRAGRSGTSTLADVGRDLGLAN
jgi:RHH-type rel operon transcriptional repressor/antitoxin RelB